MRDDFNSPAWSDNHGQLSTTIHNAIHKVIQVVTDGLARQNAYDFDAPWRPRPCAVECGERYPSA